MVLLLGRLAKCFMQLLEVARMLNSKAIQTVATVGVALLLSRRATLQELRKAFGQTV